MRGIVVRISSSLGDIKSMRQPKYLQWQNHKLSSSQILTRIYLPWKNCAQHFNDTKTSKSQNVMATHNRNAFDHLKSCCFVRASSGSDGICAVPCLRQRKLILLSFLCLSLIRMHSEETSIDASNIVIANKYMVDNNAAVGLPFEKMKTQLFHWKLLKHELLSSS